MTPDKLDKKIFGTLFFSIFAAVTGVGIVVPLLPIYARDLGASGLYVGLIFGAFSISRTFFLPYFGRLSDLKGRKPIIVPGFLAYALISIAFIYSEAVNTLIVIRFFHGIASAMLMPVIQAYIGDITPSGREGTTMGLFNMSLFLGLSIGPLIGGVIKDSFSLQASFISMGSLALIGFCLSLWLLPPTSSEIGIKNRDDSFTWKTLLYDRHLVGLFLFRFAYVVCVGIMWGFIPLYADAKFAASSSLIGVLIMLGIFVSGLLHIPMGYLADRISKKLMVVTGGLIVCYAIFSFEWADRIQDLVTSSIFFGLGGGIAMPALMAMAVLRGSKTNAMGSVMALLTVAHSLGMLSGALLGGLMMDFFKLGWAFPLGAVIMAICTGLFIVGATAQKAENTMAQ
ncbi:major facilitator superfamily MFS_1 [Olavius algarvensis Delta 1 endosymbiont]|nr:major facilitator superfamily MFS_1 [Olavius algarvensis Delta 1 endosymbiont]